MNLISVEFLLPEKTRRNWSSKYVLLANREEYIGLGVLAGTPDARHWLMATGETLPLEAVTHWATLLSVPFLTGEVDSKSLLDEDGYPSSYAHALLEKWSWNDPLGWFQLAQSIWQHGKLGFCITEEATKWSVDISALGWSGNEGLIRAMQKNEVLWSNTWKSSRTGGHHVFEVKKEDEDAQ